VVSNSSVISNSRLQWIPYEVILPTVMSAATLALTRLDAAWSIGAGKWDDLAVTSAQGLSILLNGPAAEFFGWRAPSGLVIVAVFWAWVGWLTDRRLSGNRAPVIPIRSLRRSLYALGFALGALLLFHAVTESRLQGYYSYLLKRAVWASPHAHLLGREITSLGEIIWGIFCLVYFGDKLLGLSLRTTSPTFPSTP
jgi:hypothetical protein